LEGLVAVVVAKEEGQDLGRLTREAPEGGVSLMVMLLPTLTPLEDEDEDEREGPLTTTRPCRPETDIPRERE